jgi:hypothetical protein
MNLEIGTEATQFPDKEHRNWILVGVCVCVSGGGARLALGGNGAADVCSLFSLVASVTSPM